MINKKFLAAVGLDEKDQWRLVPNKDSESPVAAGYSEEDILKVVDACFHAFSSSNRGEAKEMALRIIKTL